MLNSDELDLVEKYFKYFHGEIEVNESNADFDPNFSEVLDKAFLLKSYQYVSYYKSAKIRNCRNDARIGIINVTYSNPNSRYNYEYSEPQLVGIKHLERNYGNIIIRPETLGDKISDIFIKTDIDFKDYPEFSAKYLFIADNSLLANSFATSNRLELMQGQNDILIEIKGDILIAKYSRLINTDDFNKMIEFIRNI